MDGVSRPPLPREIRLLGIADLLFGVLAAISFVTSVGSVGSLIAATVYVCVGWGLLGSFKGARSIALSLTVCVPLCMAVASIVFGWVLPLAAGLGHQPSQISSARIAISWFTFLVWMAARLIILSRPKARELYRDSHFLDRFVDRLAVRRA